MSKLLLPERRANPVFKNACGKPFAEGMWILEHRAGAAFRPGPALFAAFPVMRGVPCHIFQLCYNTLSADKAAFQTIPGGPTEDCAITSRAPDMQAPRTVAKNNSQGTV